MEDNIIFRMYKIFWAIFIFSMLNLKLEFERYEYFKKYLNLQKKLKENILAVLYCVDTLLSDTWRGSSILRQLKFAKKRVQKWG